MALNEVLEREICLKICHMTQHAHQMCEVKFESEGIELLVASVIITNTENAALATT